MNAAKREKYNKFYMDIALRCAKMSYCERLQVGAIIVKDGRIVSHGWNGMPSGMNNCCEEEIDGELVTKSDVLHAETNALMKLAKQGDSSEGATLYITHAPCKDCSKLIHQAGITEIYYNKSYRSLQGITFLLQRGHRVEQI